MYQYKPTDMKILTARQISEWDRYTIQNEPIESLALMERAAERLSRSLQRRLSAGAKLTFLIGKGNNGGDGLAMARILSCMGFRCKVVMIFPANELNENSAVNLTRLPSDIEIRQYPCDIDDDEILIDAILGSGFRGSVNDYILTVIDHINSLPNYKVSVDMPSAMSSEYNNLYDRVLHADLTLTIQSPKLAFMLPEAGNACGELEIIDIGLDSKFLNNVKTDFYYIDSHFVANNSLRRPKFSHKGDYGHTLLVCGSEGMAGAAFLAAGAALRSGCGYVVVSLPLEYVPSLLSRYPSALTWGWHTDGLRRLPSDLEKYTSVGIGCGVGQNAQTLDLVEQLLRRYNRPIVIDADAISILATNRYLLKDIPGYSILTPHLGELRRLIGDWSDDKDKIDKVRAFAREYNVLLVVKGAHTMICCPNGDIWFNSTGNAFMAKAGTGDVLTGLISGLLARGYSPHISACMGVYYHGIAGEKATEAFSGESINSDDLIDFIRI